MASYPKDYAQVMQMVASGQTVPGMLKDFVICSELFQGIKQIEQKKPTNAKIQPSAAARKPKVFNYLKYYYAVVICVLC